MASQKVELNKVEYDDILDDLQHHFGELVKSWKDQEVGTMGSWLGLFRAMMQKVQVLRSVPGLQKADLCIDAIARIAQTLVDTNAASVSSIETVKMVLSPEGMGILRGTTSLIKDFMRGLDKDGDQEISGEELRDFFCGCCSLGKNKPSKP